MKITPLMTTDPWFTHAFNHGSAYVESLAAVPVEATVHVEQVDMLHYGAEQNYRPFLRILGEVTHMHAPEVELPYGITELELGPKQHLPLTAFYEFNEEQLADLASKGLFIPNFEVPSQMSGIPWVLPLQTRLVFVSPDTMSDPPVVFVEPQYNGVLKIDQESSGYELAEYFPNYTLQNQQALDRDHEQDEPEYGDAQRENDLFADEPYVPSTQAPSVHHDLHMPGDTELLPEAKAATVSPYERLVDLYVTDEAELTEEKALADELNDDGLAEDELEERYLQDVATRLAEQTQQDLNESVEIGFEVDEALDLDMAFEMEDHDGFDPFMDVEPDLAEHTARETEIVSPEVVELEEESEQIGDTRQSIYELIAETRELEKKDKQRKQVARARHHAVATPEATDSSFELEMD